MPPADAARRILKAVEDGFGERVDIGPIRRVAQTVALSIAGWCSLEAA